MAVTLMMRSKVEVTTEAVPPTPWCASASAGHSRLAHALESPATDAAAGLESGGQLSLAWPGVRLLRYTRPEITIAGSCDGPVFCFVVRGHLHTTAPRRAFVPGPGWGFAIAQGAESAMIALGGSEFRNHLTISVELPRECCRRVAHDFVDGRDFPSPEVNQPESVYAFPYGPELQCALGRFVHALNDERARRTLAPLYFEEIAHLLYRVPEVRVAFITALHEAGHTDPIQQAVRYIRENLTANISVTDLAREVSLSPSALAHSFRATTGTTPYQYLKRVRLDAARTMLVNDPAATVSDIAQTVGYANASHFISEFKRRFRITPGELSRGHAR